MRVPPHTQAHTHTSRCVGREESRRGRGFTLIVASLLLFFAFILKFSFAVSVDLSVSVRVCI